MENGNDKSQTVEKDGETVAFDQKISQEKQSHTSITGRPNIDDISKRNEAIIKQERETF